MTLQPNCSNYSITVGATTYNNTTSIVNLVIAANTVIYINDLTIASGVTANALLTLTQN
jgi:hypothetical protein